MLFQVSDRLTASAETPLPTPLQTPAKAEVRSSAGTDALAPSRPRLDLRPLIRDPLGAFGTSALQTVRALPSLLSDSQGVTLRFRGQPEARAFGSMQEARAAIAAAGPFSITDVILYGHGAPGMMEIDGEVLEASDVHRLLLGKLAPNAHVTLYGCNTASVGDDTLSWNPVETSFAGLSALTRRIIYFSVPVLSGSGMKAQMEGTWNADMALELSGALPGIRVTGFRTYALPADRLVPGSRRPTPSSYVAAIPVTYRDRVALD